MINCSLYIYRNEGGLLGFWKGFSACIPRAILANSVMFMTYDYAQKHLSNMEWGEDREIT